MQQGPPGGGLRRAHHVRNGDLTADGKSLWDLMCSWRSRETDVVLELDGPQAAAALEPLAEILAARGGEDYAI